MPTAADVLIEHALSFDGYVEGAGNDTPFGARTGFPRQPWCDSFVSCVAEDVGLRGVIPRSAYVPGRLDAAKAHGQTRARPRRGDLACFDWQSDGVPDHIGIVTEVIDSVHFRTVEGNTAPDDRGRQSNGGGVYRRTRRIWDVAGFIRPPYPTGEWNVLTDADIGRLLDAAAKHDGLLNAVADRLLSGKDDDTGARYKVRDGTEKIGLTEAATRLLALARAGGPAVWADGP